MYLLIFQAWATLLGFSFNERILWNGNPVYRADNHGEIYTWIDLSGITSQNLTFSPSPTLYQNWMQQVENAHMLAALMTHASLILIFAFIIMFFVFIFRLVSGMLSGRR